MKSGDKKAMRGDSDQIIHLDYRDFGRWKVEKFARYVDNLLLARRNVDLHTFRLHWDPHVPLNCNDVRKWIRYAVNHKVKVLDVELCMYDKTNLPPGIFTCRSLEDLNLQWSGAPFRDYEHKGLVLPDIIKLPSLRKLTLRDVEVHELPLESFIARSPGLEDLHLIDSAVCLEHIKSKALRRLTIDGSMYGPDRMTISAPNLISFECTGFSLEDIVWRDQPSLESAHIDTCGRTFGGESRFTGVLVHAKKLALFGCDIKLSPRLEELTLMHKQLDEAEETEGMPTDGMTFQCPLLKSVTIQYSEGDDGIDKLVDVLVANGISSDKISVTSYEDIKKRAFAEEARAEEERPKKKRAKKNPDWEDDDSDEQSNPDDPSGDEYDPDDF
ncbi:putative F-box/FBD/LRR-repeat protein At1g78760 isoform X2 [Aegilops tauschii subsp. strangulata]|uniref:F-box/LRR-repeat protein 15/At3g58940/PEG3-like LRR domain-containing protein n=1 Tax=Aegilops tauschii subsp. strangulata TaxID=200361 RepID=A0A453FQ37_AEGTS|nr:putative F-box/LRR-repeat protein At4g15060 isoform X2 [Aegilops tauschii subsp. strangulata]